MRKEAVLSGENYLKIRGKKGSNFFIYLLAVLALLFGVAFFYYGYFEGDVGSTFSGEAILEDEAGSDVPADEALIVSDEEKKEVVSDKEIEEQKIVPKPTVRPTIKDPVIPITVESVDTEPVLGTGEEAPIKSDRPCYIKDVGGIKWSRDMASIGEVIDLNIYAVDRYYCDGVKVQISLIEEDFAFFQKIVYDDKETTAIFVDGVATFRLLISEELFKALFNFFEGEFLEIVANVDLISTNNNPGGLVTGNAIDGSTYASSGVLKVAKEGSFSGQAGLDGPGGLDPTGSAPIIEGIYPNYVVQGDGRDIYVYGPDMNIVEGLYVNVNRGSFWKQTYFDPVTGATGDGSYVKVNSTHIRIVTSASLAPLAALPLVNYFKLYSGSSPGGNFNSTERSFSIISGTSPSIDSILPRLIFNDQDTTVTVSGSNYAANTRVEINGNFYATIPVSSNELRFLLPAGTLALGNHEMKLVSGTGEIGNTVDLLVVNPPVISSVSPLTINEGVTTNITITGPDMTNVHGVWAGPYFITFGNSLFSIYYIDSNTLILQIYSGTPAGNYEIRLFTAYGAGSGEIRNSTGSYNLGVVPGLSVPTPPSGLNAVAAGADGIDISWVDNSDNEVGFRVERSLTASTGFSQIAQLVGADITSYSDAGLTPGTTYYYKVRAYNSAGNSDYSNVDSATVNSGPVGGIILNQIFPYAVFNDQDTYLTFLGSSFSNPHALIGGSRYDPVGTLKYPTNSTQFTIRISEGLSRGMTTAVAVNSNGNQSGSIDLPIIVSPQINSFDPPSVLNTGVEVFTVHGLNFWHMDGINWSTIFIPIVQGTNGSNTNPSNLVNWERKSDDEIEVRVNGQGTIPQGNYSISISKSNGEDTKWSNEMDIEVYNWIDSDDDGVPDHLDLCPTTPLTPLPVVMRINNYNGCPYVRYSIFSPSLSTNLAEVRNFRNVSGFSLGIDGVGLINFTENVDLIDYVWYYRGAYSFETQVTINKKNVTINSTGAPGLDASARLTFFNTSIINPLMFKDGTYCSACVIEEYNPASTKVVARVDGFSTYDINEGFCGDGICSTSEGCDTCSDDCDVCSSTGGGTGGGGGGSSITERIINLDLEETDSIEVLIGENLVIILDGVNYVLRLRSVHTDSAVFSFGGSNKRYDFGLEYGLELDSNTGEDALAVMSSAGTGRVLVTASRIRPMEVAQEEESRLGGEGPVLPIIGEKAGIWGWVIIIVVSLLIILLVIILIVYLMKRKSGDTPQNPTPVLVQDTTKPLGSKGPSVAVEKAADVKVEPLIKTPEIVDKPDPSKKGGEDVGSSEESQSSPFFE